MSSISPAPRARSTAILRRFSDVTPKLIGVASSNWNPQNVARMLAKDNPDIFREEVDLTPHMAYLVMYPGDTLAIRTQDGGRVCVQIVVTELAESEHVSLALGTPPEPQWRRFRLIRDLSGGFSHLPLNNTYSPPFHWDPGLSMLVTNAIGDGPIPARDLCMYPTFQGCYVSVRYAGINADAQLHIVDGVLRDSAPYQPTSNPCAGRRSTSSATTTSSACGPPRPSAAPSCVTSSSCASSPAIASAGATRTISNPAAQATKKRPEPCTSTPLV
ncbi:MAG: hypothetical protein IPK80_14910 [Nannocystis sp.]|nr:hypothetical protein [Nannocystis sp.]